MGAASADTAAPAAQGRNLPVAQVDAAPGQRIDGFGASGAWWPNDLEKFPRHGWDVHLAPQAVVTYTFS